jgi:hypothetical protein
MSGIETHPVDIDRQLTFYGWLRWIDSFRRANLAQP